MAARTFFQVHILGISASYKVFSHLGVWLYAAVFASARLWRGVQDSDATSHNQSKRLILLHLRRFARF